MSEYSENGRNEKYLGQALMLSNKVKKRYKHLGRRYKRENIEIFRLYDWDIPEINAVVDWYAGHLVVAEYVKKKSDPRWIRIMSEAVGQALDVPIKNIHIKERHTGYQDGNRYSRVAHTDRTIVMSERDLKFGINLDDYVDTGLFSDHRNTRQMVREMAEGKDFLNLYCYTGSFSCYAAKGGARTTVSVDRSETAIQWAKENMELNEIKVADSFQVKKEKIEPNIIEVEDTFQVKGMAKNQKNTLIKAHTFDFLEKAKKKGQMFDLAVVDPPSFSSSRTLNVRREPDSSRDLNSRMNSDSSGDLHSKDMDLKHHFDIVQDHITLLKAVIDVMRKDSDSIIFFSTNHQDFELHIDELMSIDAADGTDINEQVFGKAVKEIKEITSITIPEDYRTPKKKIHRCWRIVV